jgi:AcrR family transcriptional regulator
VEARLFDAVSRLCEQGDVSFSELSIGRLAEEAGIARATFYLYFPDRTAFALRLAERAGELLAPTFGALWRRSGTDRTALEGAMLDLVMTFRDAQGLMSAPVEAGAADPAVKAQLDLQMGGLIDATERSFVAGQRQGLIRPDIQVRETAEALTLMIQSGLYSLVRGSDPTRARQLAVAFAQICWHTLHGHRD